MGKRITNILTAFLILVLLAACSTGSKASLAELLDLLTQLIKLSYRSGEYDFISVIGDGLIWAKKGNDSQIIEI